MEQRLHSRHVASKDIQQVGESVCTNAWCPEVHMDTMYIITKKFHFYPKLVKQIYLVTDSFHVTAMLQAVFTPSLSSFRHFCFLSD